MLRFLQKRWFLLALVLLISSGMALGTRLSPEAAWRFAERWPAGVQAGLLHFSRLTTAIVLFLMAFSLDTRQLRTAVRAPGPAAWASLVNYVAIPLMAWPLMWVQRTRDFQIGLMIAASVPCTMAAASVWTRKARGNDAVSLMVTLVTNASSFLVTPFWLNLTIAGAGVSLDGGRMIVDLIVSVLIPIVIGQALQLLPRPKAFAQRHKTAIGVVAQALILLLVFVSSWRAGAQLTTRSAGPGVAAVVLVWASCIALHVGAMTLAALGARIGRFSREETAAVMFAGSQKTLPIGVLLASNPAFGAPFAVFPMLMYHASQLFIDTAVADRLAAAAGRED
jgi:sodium/bile acid cotransporter 7